MPKKWINPYKAATVGRGMCAANRQRNNSAATDHLSLAASVVSTRFHSLPSRQQVVQILPLLACWNATDKQCLSVLEVRAHVDTPAIHARHLNRNLRAAIRRR